MLNTLGLDDDLDPVEVVIAVEKAFDVKISNAEATAIYHVGELHDLLLQKLASYDGNQKCASAMAFYRLRRAMVGLVHDTKASPSFDMLSLQASYTRKLVKSLEATSGLRLPEPSFGPLGKAGSTLLLTGLLGAATTLVVGLVLAFLSVHIGGAVVESCSLLLVGGFVAGITLMRLDPGRLPKGCTTLGALAERAGNLSYGRLIREGASAREGTIWKALVEVLADFAIVPADQIGRETYFLGSSVKKTTAAA